MTDRTSKNNKTTSITSPGLDNIQDASKRNVNIFILGDLLIDHTAFVRGSIATYPPPITGEISMQVMRRVDNAGGAATTARMINMLSSGSTFLWGITGKSPWGSFRTILENSQALDGAIQRIELRGVHDETDASMTTINRLVAVHDLGAGRLRYERKVRFTDYGHIHVPINRQKEGIIYHLDRVNKTKAPLDAIILNDLDMGALRHEIVNEISNFASQYHIPLIVRARRDSSKYLDVPANALICTLAEWQQLVNTKVELPYWANNIQKKEIADEFARLTLGIFRKVDRFVVLVGDDWIETIIVVSRPNIAADACLVSTINGMPLAEKGKSQQVGASDVFTGALALGAFSKGDYGQTFQTAVTCAIRLVHAYQHKRWHIMPTPEDLTDDSVAIGKDHALLTSHHFGTPYLPNSSSIDLNTAKTCIPNIYTVTPSFSNLLKQMVKSVKDDDKTIVLVAGGGSGKTEISNQLLITAHQSGLDAFSFNELNIEWDWGNPKKTIQNITNASKKRSSNSNMPFIKVDEVLKNKNANKFPSTGVVLLEGAKEAGIRFLLVDADFLKINFEKIRSQFARRVAWYQLPSAWERPKDIPYVLAAFLRQHTVKEVNFSIQAPALVSIIEWMLKEKHNFGELRTLAYNILSEIKLAEHTVIQWEHLPSQVKGKYQPHQEMKDHLYKIEFD